jgi:hypothetical protein
MKASVRLEHQLLAVETEHEVHAMLQLVAPSAPKAKPRPPLHLARRAVQAHGLGSYISVEWDRPPDWALYLDAQWREKETPWPSRFVDWPDYGLPLDEADAFDAFIDAWERVVRGDVIDIACEGGTGRTGVALACLAILAAAKPSRRRDRRIPVARARHGQRRRHKFQGDGTDQG